jgi:hypothetical protein
VLAWCDEVGNAFLNPRDLAASMTTGEAAQCPACRMRDLREFVEASSQQILKAGLQGRYE